MIRRRPFVDSPGWTVLCAAIFAFGVIASKEIGDRLDSWRPALVAEARGCR